jgi:hypothetical protein
MQPSCSAVRTYIELEDFYRFVDFELSMYCQTIQDFQESTSARLSQHLKFAVTSYRFKHHFR